MGFLGKAIKGIGKAIGNGIKKIASSALGQTLLKIGLSAIAPPIGGILGSAAMSLIANKGKLSFKSLVDIGMSAFGGVAGKFGLSNLVKNLPINLTNPTGLLKGGVGQILNNVLKGSSLGGKIGNILTQASGILSKVQGGASKASSIANMVGGILDTLGVKRPRFLNQATQGISTVTTALQKAQDFLNKILMPAPTGPMVLRA
ncbi:MAG: hypothetical protein AB1489_26965 [Acidobacteriota bacterium]